MNAGTSSEAGEERKDGVVWYRKSIDAPLRKALIKAGALENQPTWVAVES